MKEIVLLIDTRVISKYKQIQDNLLDMVVKELYLVAPYLFTKDYKGSNNTTHSTIVSSLSNKEYTDYVIFVTYLYKMITLATTHIQGVINYTTDIRTGYITIHLKECEV